MIHLVSKCDFFIKLLFKTEKTQPDRTRKLAVFRFIKVSTNRKSLQLGFRGKAKHTRVDSSIIICWGQFETTAADYSLWEHVSKGEPTRIKATSLWRCLAYFIIIPLDPTVGTVTSRTSFSVSTRRWDVTMADFESRGPVEHAGWLFFSLTQIQDDKPRRHPDCRCAALSTRCPNFWKVKRQK